MILGGDAMRIEVNAVPSGNEAEHPTCLEVHPIYGAVYKDGEFVTQGAVIGLSTDMKAVVITPVSGWVRLVRKRPFDPPSDDKPGLRVEIWPQRHAVALLPTDPGHERR